MTLTEFLVALENTQAVITVKDDTEGNPELVKFYASGYQQILADTFGNWCVPIRGATAHDYPFYQEDEKRIAEYRRSKGI